MKAVDRLKRDHKILRAKLDVLEAALAMGPETWFVLREICHTLSRQLQHHIRREEALVAACRQSLSPEALAHQAVEHHDEPELLRAVNRLFIEEQGRSLEQVRPTMMKLIQGLRRHMDEEEQELFPAIERTLATREPMEPQRAAAVSFVLEETVSVNSVVHAHPETRLIFDQLFISIPYEGYDSLDEVAWRRGLEAHELLERLQGAITPPAASPRNRPPSGRDRKHEPDAASGQPVGA